MLETADRGEWKLCPPLKVVLVAEVADACCDGDLPLSTFLMACERRDLSCADSWDTY